MLALSTARCGVTTTTGPPGWESSHFTARRFWASRESSSPSREIATGTSGTATSPCVAFVIAAYRGGPTSRLERNPGGDGRDHERSHGQAFTELLNTKLVYLSRRGGFLVLDEPEAGLSFMTQIKPANLLAELRHDAIQVLMATPSPNPPPPRRPNHRTRRGRTTDPCLEGPDDRGAVPAVPRRPRLLRHGMSTRHRGGAIRSNRGSCGCSAIAQFSASAAGDFRAAWWPSSSARRHS